MALMNIEIVLIDIKTYMDNNNTHSMIANKLCFKLLNDLLTKNHTLLNP